MELKQAFWILRHGSGEGLWEYLKAVKTIEDSCVPVVRCKDCKYYDPEDWDGIACKADGGMTAPYEDSFCSQGERRKDNENR
jgi:hypothetical protein